MSLVWMEASPEQRVVCQHESSCIHFVLTFFFKAFIESVIVVSNQNQQEGSPMSLLIRTPKRDIKITAPSLERHEIWHKVRKKKKEIEK